MNSDNTMEKSVASILRRQSSKGNIIRRGREEEDEDEVTTEIKRELNQLLELINNTSKDQFDLHTPNLER